MKFGKLQPILGSSSNPEKLSESIRGTLILAVPIIVKISSVDIPEDTLIEFINNGSIFWGSCVATFGLGRKLYYRAINIYNNFIK